MNDVHRSKPGSRSHPDPRRAERHFWKSVANPTTNERGKYYSLRFIRWYAIYGISPIEFVRILFSLLLLFLSVWILFGRYLKNEINNRLRIFTVSMSSTGIVLITSFHVITQPWRQLYAPFCVFHLIMNIFITMPHKLLKFCTHKLQMISQHTDNPCPPCASRRARARASKF